LIVGNGSRFSVAAVEAENFSRFGTLPVGTNGLSLLRSLPLY
jgi:hypothetical protein